MNRIKKYIILVFNNFPKNIVADVVKENDQLLSNNSKETSWVNAVLLPNRRGTTEGLQSTLKSYKIKTFNKTTNNNRNALLRIMDKILFTSMQVVSTVKL